MTLASRVPRHKASQSIAMVTMMNDDRSDCASPASTPRLSSADVEPGANDATELPSDEGCAESSERVASSSTAAERGASDAIDLTSDEEGAEASERAASPSTVVEPGASDVNELPSDEGGADVDTHDARHMRVADLYNTSLEEW